MSGSPTSHSPARVLAVCLGGVGAVLLAGPAVRALTATYGRIDLLASPAGAQAGALLPGVGDVHTFDAPWVGRTPPPVTRGSVDGLVATLAARGYRLAVVFTAGDEAGLPTALLARLAGIPRIVAASREQPGSLVDVRHRRPPGLHEVEAGLDLAGQADAHLPPDDAGLLAVRRPLPDVPLDHLRAEALTGHASRTVVLHPGAAVPARAPRPEDARATAAHLAARGWDVVVTGTATERGLTAFVAGDHAVDLGGRTDLAQLAAVLEAAACLVAGDTAPAHLAAAVGTPVVSLFAPVEPDDRFAPYGVPHLVLGDQAAPCRGTRASACPVPGHPCLAGVTPAQVADAVDRLTTSLP